LLSSWLIWTFLAHNREVKKVAFVKDDAAQRYLLITCSHDSVKVWTLSPGADDTVSLSEENEIKGWRNGVQDFDVTADGKIAAIVSVDSTLHQITLPADDHSVASREVFDTGFMEIWFLCIVPNQSEYISTRYSGSLIALDMTGKVTKTAPFNGVKQISALACVCIVHISPDGKSVAVANNEGIVTIVDSANLASKFYFEAHALKVRAINFSPDSKHVLTGSDDKTVKLYEILGSKAQHVSTFCGHRNYITAVQFDRSYDGQRFASCSNDSSVIIWNAQSTQPLYMFQNLHEGVVTSVSFSFDNQFLASVGEDRTICISRVDDGTRQVVGKDSELTQDNEPQAQEYSNNIYDSEEIHGYSATLFDSHYSTGPQEEEEDELLVRARRDLEAASDDEKIS
uniref:WD_REPEATS_REGION domain-containing protein n=1 Tax=Enterobius vermicularis TaxID=51028 RepID=A0A158Q9J4_ENTVE